MGNRAASAIAILVILLAGTACPKATEQAATAPPPATPERHYIADVPPVPEGLMASG